MPRREVGSQNISCRAASAYRNTLRRNSCQVTQLRRRKREHGRVVSSFLFHTAIPSRRKPWTSFWCVKTCPESFAHTPSLTSVSAAPNGSCPALVPPKRSGLQRRARDVRCVEGRQRSVSALALTFHADGQEKPRLVGQPFSFGGAVFGLVAYESRFLLPAIDPTALEQPSSSVIDVTSISEGQDTETAGRDSGARVVICSSPQWRKGLGRNPVIAYLLDAYCSDLGRSSQVSGYVGVCHLPV
jgi:hypothetical protein